MGHEEMLVVTRSTLLNFEGVQRAREWPRAKARVVCEVSTHACSSARSFSHPPDSNDERALPIFGDPAGAAGDEGGHVRRSERRGERGDGRGERGEGSGGDEPVRAGPSRFDTVHTGYLQSQRTPALHGVGSPWPSAPAGHRKTLRCFCKFYTQRRSP